jgi:hypothetical protein
MRTSALLFFSAVLALAGCAGGEAGPSADRLEVPIRRELYPIVAGAPAGNFAVTGSSCVSSRDGRYECVVEWVSGFDSKHGSATATLMCDRTSCVGYWTWGRRIAFDF